MVLLMVVAGATPLAAQPRAPIAEPLPTGTFITPFPEGDTHRVQVYGESVAEGMLGGLAEAMAKEPKVVIQRRARTLANMLKAEIADEVRAIEGELERETPHIALLMPNMIFRFPWREGFDRRFPPGSEARREEIQRRRDVWKAERGQRIDTVLRALKRKGVAVYLVGQPVMRNTFTSEDAQVVNELLRERAIVNGAKYIDIYASFADETGAFDPQGPDVDGKPRMLRDQDGVSFTAAGFRKLGHFVERELKRDLALARTERQVPLAGGEEEQRRIRPSVPVQAISSKGGIAGATKDGRPVTAPARPGPAPGQSTQRADGGGEDVKADNSRITLKTINLQGREDSLTIEIVRPPIPASLLAAVTRRASPDKPSQLGDPVITEIPGGQAVVSSVTPAAEGAGADRRRGATGLNTPYQLVLEKGQRLTPKPGRSDDMPWPRQETLPPAAAAAAAPLAPDVRRPPTKGQPQQQPRAPGPRG